MILKLTNEGGRFIYINEGSILYFRERKITNANTLIQLNYQSGSGESYFYVKNTPEEIFKMIREGYVL